MKTLCVLIVVLFSLQSFGQDNFNRYMIDSLSRELKIKKNDTTQYRLYRWLARDTKLQPELSLKYWDSALVVLKKMDWTKGYVNYYGDLALYYDERSIYDKAIEYAHKSLEYSKNNPQLRIYALTSLTTQYIKQKNDSLAQFYNEQIPAIANKEKLWVQMIHYYNNAAIIEKDTLKKQEFYNKILASSFANVGDKGLAYMRLARLLKNPKERILYFEKSKKIFDSIAPNYIISVGNPIDLAKEYLFLAQHDSIRIASKILENREQLLQRAESYILGAIDVSKKLNGYQTLFESYKVLSDIKKEIGDYREAFKYSEMFHKSMDSLFSQENKNKIAKIESQKEIELRDKEIQLNTIALKAKEREKWLYIAGICFLLVLGGLLFYQSSNRRKTNKKLGLLNTELDNSNKELDQANKNKTRFFSILNHDLRSPVANLIHFLHLQKNNPELMDEATRQRLENRTMTGAENLLSSMEDILLWSKGQMENFKPKPKTVQVDELYEDTKKVFSGYLNITFIYNNPEKMEIFTDKDYVKTIVRNLTSNAINVFTNTSNPTITWNAWKDESNSYLSITDNGPGATETQFKTLYDESQVVGIKSGLGLHLIRDMANAIDCTIKVDSKIDFGTTITLSFK